MAEWLRRLTLKPKVGTAVGSNPTLDTLVAVRNTSPDDVNKIILQLTIDFIHKTGRLG